MADEGVIITPYQDGPYLVRGPVVLRDQAGRSITINRKTVALCRCGKSRMRPFCDGTHHVIRFRAPSSAEPPPALRGGFGGEGTGSAGGPTGQ
jgi:CDGSH-type Zn-finger protein